MLALGVFLVINTYSMLLTHHRDLIHGSNNSSQKIMKEISDQIYNISDSIAYDSRTIEMLGGDMKAKESFAMRQEITHLSIILSKITVRLEA